MQACYACTAQLSTILDLLNTNEIIFPDSELTSEEQITTLEQAIRFSLTGNYHDFLLNYHDADWESSSDDNLRLGFFVPTAPQSEIQSRGIL